MTDLYMNITLAAMWRMDWMGPEYLWRKVAPLLFFLPFLQPGSPVQTLAVSCLPAEDTSTVVPSQCPFSVAARLTFPFLSTEKKSVILHVLKVKSKLLSWSTNPFNPGHVSLSSVLSNHLSLSTLCLSP